MKSVFVFRRDLRLYDNIGLIEALSHSDEVLPIFIFTPEQIKDNAYKGSNSVEFLFNSLYDLDEELKKYGTRLSIFYGDPIEILSNLSFDTLYFNKDYTPYSIARDRTLEEYFVTKSYDDILLHAPNKVLKDDGKPYTVFTPYYKKALTKTIEKPKELPSTNFSKLNSNSLDEMKEKFLPKTNPNIAVKGGRKEALKILDELTLKDYENKRDIPSLKGVSQLSAHNKFGTISPRELYYKTLHKSEAFTRQLYWRSFFTQIAYHFPYVFGEAFQKKFDAVKWDYDEEMFKRWCEGTTGFPIVDAGMRELNTTGYMHNRVRMITASFLTKDLHIDWRWGEKYFAQKLVDYDPCVNNGSWQWAASTGCDAQPYFRIFNPWRQQIRFDPDCVYIKKWIEELKGVSSKAIHNLAEQQPLGCENYPRPIVDHFKEKKETLKRFENL